MARFTITIEGDALEELQDMVAEIQQQQPGNPIKTPQQYLQNFCQAMLEDRVRQEYIGYVNRQDHANLKAKLGPLKDIKHGK